MVFGHYMGSLSLPLQAFDAFERHFASIGHCDRTRRIGTESVRAMGRRIVDQGAVSQCDSPAAETRAGGPPGGVERGGGPAPPPAAGGARPPRAGARGGPAPPRPPPSRPPADLNV